MKIKRIRLKNFCGVESAEVRFAMCGITLIHGPNEAGKSTLMAAMDLLFDQRDDSNRQDVRKTKHVNRDVGAEVEADVEIGPYQFTYFKRFHKDRETVLKIDTPRAESLSGREAHDRVRQIIDGSIDTGLWKALRILQGGDLDMPVLQNQIALSAALDRAAGQTQAGDKENALFDAADAEYALYYTDKGREKESPLGKARQLSGDAIAKEEGLQSELKSLESDINRYSSLERMISNLKNGLVGLEAAGLKAKNKWETISRLTDDLDRSRSAKQLTEHVQQASQSAQNRRNELISQVKLAFEKAKRSKSDNAKTTSALQEADLSLKKTRTELDSATTSSTELQTEESIRRADLAFREDAFELKRMLERLQHVNAAEAAAAQASTLVAATKLTEKIRIEIRNAEVQFKTKQGILSSASPKFSITALKSVSISVNGRQLTLAAGQVKKMVLSTSISATIGRFAEVLMEPGTSADALNKDVEEARAALTNACSRAAVADSDEAERVWSDLLDAKRTLTDRDRVVREHLRDLTHEALGRFTQDLAAKVDAYEPKRSSVISLPSSIDECEALLAATTVSSQTAKSIQRQAIKQHLFCKFRF